MAGSLEIPVVGEKVSTGDPKFIKGLETFNGLLGASNKITGTGIEAAAGIGAGQLAAAAKPFVWYTPKVIATEQTRESASFGTLTTADEIKEVVLPENGLIQIGYVAKWKSSVAAAGKAAIFIGANQLKFGGTGAVAETASSGTEFNILSSVSNENGLNSVGSATAAFVTTGEAIGASTQGGFCSIFAAAGTYNISLQFRSTSGSITAKERKLWVAVLGV